MKQPHRILAGLLILASLLTAPSAQAAEGKRVNINSADSSQLMMLPRIGSRVADRIVDYRRENGPFKKAEDLMLVGGIGEKMFEVLKPYIALSGESTLDEKPHASRSRSRSGSKAGSKAGAKTGAESASKAGARPRSGSKAAPKPKQASESGFRATSGSVSRSGHRKGSH
jgi:competence protein ComEA